MSRVKCFISWFLHFTKHVLTFQLSFNRLHIMENYECPRCSFKITNLRLFIKHIRRHERNDPYFTIACKMCNKVLAGTRNWQIHVTKYHVRLGHCDPSKEANMPSLHSDPQANETQDACVPPECHLTRESSPDAIDPDASCTDASDGSHMDVGSFVMDLRSRNVPQKVCDEVVDQLKKFAGQLASEYQACVANCRDGENVDISTLPSVSALDEVSNVKRQDKYARRKLGMVPPETKVLKSENDESKDTFQFIPVTQQIKSLFSNKSFADAFIEATGVPQSDGAEQEYADLKDGSFHKNADNDSLKLIIYSDEFTVSCPIGNKTKKYGIVAVYFAIANMRRSRLQNIHLALLVHKSHLRRHSWATTLKPLIDDLKALQADGVAVELNGAIKQLKGSVALVVGDNLGIHEMAGYFCSFHGTGRICRICHATTSEIQEKFKESDFVLRTQAEYDAQLKILEQENFSEVFQKMFGIKERCVFSQLEGFRCIDQMPVDMSHDLLEGVALYTVNCVFSGVVHLNLTVT